MLPRLGPLPARAGLYADGAYNSDDCRFVCRQHGLRDHIPKVGEKGSSHLGGVRWVVERTLAWLKQFRRLLIRYDRRAQLVLALLQLACAIIALRFRR